MNNNMLLNFALNQLQKNPNVANTPLGQQFMQVLQTGDQNAGIQIANNILQSAGVSREQGIQQARSMFHI